MEEDENFLSPKEIKMELGKGQVEVEIGVKEDLFYRTLSKESGVEIHGELELMQYVRSLSEVKKGYDKIKDAFTDAEKNGYGIVYPDAEDFALQKPQLMKKNASYGVKFRANAPSYHIVRVDVTGAVNPIIGTKQQGEDFVDDALKLYDEREQEVWETNIFGKSLRSLVEDELSSKTNAMPIELRKKMRRTISKIVNEGKGNVFCILF